MMRLLFLFPLLFCLLACKKKEKTSLPTEQTTTNVTKDSFAQKIAGEWQLVSINGKSTNRKADITFRENGTFERFVNRDTQEGAWQWNGTAKELTLTSDDKTEIVSIEELTQESLRLKNKSNVFAFAKKGKAQDTNSILDELTDDNAKYLVGKWQAVSMGGKTPPLDMFVTFRKDGTATQSVVSKNKKENKREITWEWEEEGKILNLNSGDKTERVTMETLTAKRLVFRDGRNTFEFKKVK